MKASTIIYKNKLFPNGVHLASSSFCPGKGLAEEHHLILTCHGLKGKTEDLIGALIEAFHMAETESGFTPVFARWFLSDITNQEPLIPKECLGCATSTIGQAPLDASKIALWVYGISDAVSAREGTNLYAVTHGPYTHIWMGDCLESRLEPEPATVSILSDYVAFLDKYGCSLSTNCLRTWFFVRDVDLNYKGMVRGRNNVFDLTGLTGDSHFIASTGIEGKKADPKQRVAFNAYAVKGLHENQIKYLKAPSHLNSTLEYGVAFERGTSIDYGDRRHVIISGTASINKYGEVEHRGDVKLQTERMLENIAKLLEEAETGWENVNHAIVYLRDFSDYEKVERILSEKLPYIPKVLLEAPVCRPGWLVEMECMAVKEIKCAQFAPF